MDRDIVDGGIPAQGGELVQATAGDHELADQVHQGVEPPQVDTQMARPAAFDRRTLHARRRALVLGDSDLVHVAGALDRRRDRGRVRVRFEPEREPPVEVLGLERGDGRRHGVHGP